ncbi:D-glycero-beta-D-manno-heptose 1,7-bisphosphate 7-phosphatase [Sulfurimonas aquatica]|uniref:D,D-heptose 1,7-bisphosphate phosphatase n=1 Tax=Sulfurimonas aquatica TaxID=2672570 RepID=A0A975AZE6_9BACT|nr:D-glycero-beta-D-manno-heptose 1,7-bisphosphate 7-phosphatase [Sulfurimonas aquatica]QSZ41313.1 D-glycero-beta-D-manno-heptose 1,7-bisphosphate 7-phosphatase [Sulfurimonas aquatica]
MNKTLFLDRDGVINTEKDYLYKVEDFDFINGIFDLCRYYQDLGYLIVVVTNQSGIARGYYSEDDFNILTNWMLEEFFNNDVIISGVYFCPHHPDISGECECRKPSPGMLFDAKNDLDIDLENSIIIGDKERDIEAGINAGLKLTYLFDESNKVTNSKATYILNKFADIRE